MCGIKRLFKIDPITATPPMIIIGTVVAFALFAWQDYKFDHAPVTGEHTHWYGEVRTIGNCDQSKHTLRCHVYVHGREKPYYLDVSDFPGHNVTVGDRIGYLHMEKGGGYLSYMRRNDRLLSTGICHQWMACAAIYNEDHGYSK